MIVRVRVLMSSLLSSEVFFSNYHFIKSAVVRNFRIAEGRINYSEIPNNWSVSVSLVGRTGAVAC